jgi:hypothetical protein
LTTHRPNQRGLGRQDASNPYRPKALAAPAEALADLRGAQLAELPPPSGVRGSYVAEFWAASKARPSNRAI